MSIPVSFADQMINSKMLNVTLSFALVESGYSLNLNFTLLGEQVFTQASSWERCYPGV